MIILVYTGRALLFIRFDISECQSRQTKGRIVSLLLNIEEIGRHMLFDL